MCVVGDDGKVTFSYGCQPGFDVGQLNSPCHLAVDKDSQFIFVADNRVVLCWQLRRGAGSVVKLVEPMEGGLGDVNYPALPMDRARFGSGSPSPLDLKV